MKDLNTQVPMEDYLALKQLAELNGWSIAEALRRGAKLLLARHMQMVHIPLSASNGSDGS
jgi:hypothetical protein